MEIDNKYSETEFVNEFYGKLFKEIANRLELKSPGMTIEFKKLTNKRDINSETFCDNYVSFILRKDGFRFRIKVEFIEPLSIRLESIVSDGIAVITKNTHESLDVVTGKMLRLFDIYIDEQSAIKNLRTYFN